MWVSVMLLLALALVCLAEYLEIAHDAERRLDRERGPNEWLTLNTREPRRTSKLQVLIVSLLSASLLLLLLPLLLPKKMFSLAESVLHWLYNV